MGIGTSGKKGRREEKERIKEEGNGKRRGKRERSNNIQSTE